MDKLRALEYFTKVVDLGSFTAAAKAIGVPASSVSRRIQDLEADLGATLLIRTTRSVRLTELGALYLEQIRPAIRTLGLASELIKDHPSSPSGLLRITATPGYGKFLLVPALKKLRQRFPDLVIDLELTDQVSNLAGDGVDIAVRATATLPDRAIARKLVENDYVLLASPTYLARHGTPQNIEDLAEHQALLYRGPGRAMHWQAKTKDGWSETKSHAAFICNIGEELIAEAVAGNGLALVPRWGVRAELNDGRLSEIRLSGATLTVSRNQTSGIFLLYHQPKYRLNKIKASVDFLLEELRQ